MRVATPFFFSPNFLCAEALSLWTDPTPEALKQA